MPIVTIQTPTGEAVQIEAPEGATDEQILRFAKSQGLFDSQSQQALGQAQAAQQLPSVNPDVPMGGAGDPFPQNQLQPQASPQQQAGFGEQVLGGLEAAAAMGSSIIAEPVAGLAGIAASLNPFGEEGAGAGRVKQVREALTYKPSLPGAQAALESTGDVLRPVGEFLQEREKNIGGFTLEATGSPALATIAHSLPTAALELLGVKGARKVTSASEPSNKLIKKTLIESAPEVEKVKAASRILFNEVDESGAVVKRSSLGKLSDSLDGLAQKEGIREGVSEPVFNAIKAIKKDVSRDIPIPINEITDLRKIAQNATSATDPNVTRQALLVLDEVDSFIDSIKMDDLTRTGNISPADISKKLGNARKLYGRAKRAEMLQNAITMGASRKAGIEKGIRNELNNLINRKKSRKFLNKDDIAAIRKVTDGDFKQNFSSLVGGMGLKLENSPSMFNALISGGGAGGLAASMGMSGAALPAAITAVTVGTASKQIANKLARNSADFLKTMQLAGNDAERVTRAYLKAVPKSKRKISDLSDLLLDPSIDLSVLDSIANETVQDAVKAAKFKREILQATAAASVGGALGAKESVGNEERQ